MDAVSLTRIYEHEQETKHLVSPEHALKVALARIEKRTIAKSIFFGWPNLEQASRNLARMISHLYPDQGGQGFLLDNALQAAFDAYEKVSGHAVLDTKLMTCFLDTLIDTAAQGLAEWRTHGLLDDSETVAWPAISMPIFEWVKRRRVERLVFTKRTDAGDAVEMHAIRMMLTSALLTLNDVINVTRERGG